ncbi:hypothetical protein, partial [Acetobacter tropicalis]|uniref:hypothetical protein n=1 Tax=Acetobacter tropicalis TaxID=104102 RepID=UPI001F31C868
MQLSVVRGDRLGRDEGEPAGDSYRRLPDGRWWSDRGSGNGSGFFLDVSDPGHEPWNTVVDFQP